MRINGGMDKRVSWRGDHRAPWKYLRMDLIVDETFACLRTRVCERILPAFYCVLLVSAILCVAFTKGSRPRASGQQAARSAQQHDSRCSGYVFDNSVRLIVPRCITRVLAHTNVREDSPRTLYSPSLEAPRDPSPACTENYIPSNSPSFYYIHYFSLFNITSLKKH